jgi:hypothetical protein
MKKIIRRENLKCWWIYIIDKSETIIYNITTALAAGSPFTS